MEPKQSKENALFEWYDSLVFALAVIVLFFVFAVRIITVSGVSMQPTLYGGDRVAVQSMLYTPQRGDVVVVDGYINYGDPLVKRIIALGGDTVDINFETGAVTLNGAVLEEPYISAPTTTGYDVEFPVTVPEGCVFVMGDNRPRSLDGRSTEVGFIDERDMLWCWVPSFPPSLRWCTWHWALWACRCWQTSPAVSISSSAPPAASSFLSP